MTYDKRKWLLLSATIVAFLVVIWQIHAMMSSDFVSPQPAVHSLKPAAHTVPTARRAVSAMQGSAMGQQKTTLYVQLAKEIEIAKMKRQLLEEQVAIARAEQRLAAMHSAVSGMSSLHQTPTSLPQTGHDYTLLAIAKQANQGWRATLNIDGRIVTVRVGQQLPNGDEVIHMGHDQVWIDQHQRAIAVSFKGTQPLSMRSVEMARKARQAHKDTPSQPAAAAPAAKHTAAVSSSAVSASFGHQEKTQTIAIPQPKEKKEKAKATKAAPKQKAAVKHVTVSLASDTPAWMDPVTYLTNV